MSKTLAVDYGKKKFGLAISDELEMVTAKLPILWIKKQRDMIDGLRFIINETSPSTILFGIPYGEDGGETIQSKEVREFIQKFKDTLGSTFPNLIIKTWDESFSTQRAEKGKSRKFKKEKADSEAARIFLQEYLDSPENKVAENHN